MDMKGMDLTSSPAYEHTGTTSGVSYRIRAWASPDSKMVYTQVDASGSSNAEISISIPSLPFSLDLNGNNSQSLFLNVIEYSAGNEVSGQNNVGALIISKNGAMRLYIREDAAIIDGSSDTKIFKMQ